MRAEYSPPYENISNIKQDNRSYIDKAQVLSLSTYTSSWPDNKHRAESNSPSRSSPDPPAGLHSSSPITRLPVDILLYIASLRFLTLNDIVQWRATASVFYHSIQIPHAAMILQAAYLFQVRPRRGHRQLDQQQSPSTSSVQPALQPLQVVRPAKDIHSTYKDRQLQEIIARLTRLLLHPEFQPRLMRSTYSFRNRDPLISSLSSHHQHSYPRTIKKRTERIRRDLQDYPIFLTGNPPDLVRLAIEFGHVPFIDHLLYRGFRPRDLPEYFPLIPFLPVLNHNATDLAEESDKGVNPLEQEQAQAALLKRSRELSQIWECMHIASQELMDACSRADLEAVINVLDAALVHPRLSLDSTSHHQCDIHNSIPPEGTNYKGKQRQEYQADLQNEPDTSGAGPNAQVAEDDSHGLTGVGVGSSSSEVTHELRLASLAPIATHRSRMFRTRQRVNSNSSQQQQHPITRSSFSGLVPEQQELQSHMPWIDGRALTGALLAICFRRVGFDSPDDEALEESRAVLIVQEILKYDCMITAQSLGQAVLGIAYSRPRGSLKRAYDQRLQQQQGESRYGPKPHGGIETQRDKNGVHIGVMDLLMERIGPREWLKLIEHYLQLRAFEDLAVVLERCPFKGSQFEILDNGREGDQDHQSRARLRDTAVEPNHHHQQARELLCREAGICGMGARLTHFTGRGAGQAEYNVSSMFHESSRILFTGSGTRFSNNYMLPRGGFRGIGSNSSDHAGSVWGGEPAFDAMESYRAVELNSNMGTSDTEIAHPFGHPTLPGSEQLEPQQQYPHLYRGHGADDDGDDGGASGVGTEVLGLQQDQIDYQDSNLAFDSMGSSTTTSLRPGPGIVGIAVQVQAPENILKALLKLGFRFLRICDLSIADNRHPLALQFQQQEKMNSQLIEFCMIPNAERQEATSVGPESGSRVVQGTDYGDRALRTMIKRDSRRFDTADQELHAMATQQFLYPAVDDSMRGSVSIPVLPSGDADSSTHSSSDASNQKSLVVPTSSPSSSNMAPFPTIAPSEMSKETRPTVVSTTSPPSTPSGRLQFMLPPIQLGDSFDDIAAAADFQWSVQPQLSPIQSPLNQEQYRKCGLSKLIPLPNRTSMVESRITMGSSHWESGRGKDAGADKAARTALKAQQRMLSEATKSKVREHLSSKYIDLTTVGICLSQACYYQKELLLSTLLEHRLLIAQDALTGAVQVAASVGWKRGLEILLMQQGDLEAEIEPVVTTTSEYVHLGASMKWDYATAPQMCLPNNKMSSSNSKTASPGSRRNTRVVTAGGLVDRGIRRYQSDNSPLNRFGVSEVSIDNSNVYGAPSPVQSFEFNRRSSVDFSHTPSYSSTRHPSTPVETTLMGPVIPTARSSSLKSMLSGVLPNLAASLPNTPFKESPKVNQKQRATGQRSQERTQGQSLESERLQEVQRSKSMPPTIMLSTATLWSLPSVMMKRKSRNAVIALMAACSRNDPGLVHWLVDSFADIKVVHIMQALMIACDRGLIAVVQVLVGDSSVTPHGSGNRNRDESRDLFRKWLAFQHKRIMELTVPYGRILVTEEGSSSQRFDSFPFLFLMESSPIFRHYYRILNTLSTCQFMKRRGSNPERYTLSHSQPHQQSLASSPQPQEQSRQQYQARERTRPLMLKESKHEIIRILLDPILKTLGPISVRKALDKMPQDCWWPLDHDVRLAVDQEARKAMVEIVTAEKQQQRELGQHSYHGYRFENKIVKEVGHDGSDGMQRNEQCHKTTGHWRNVQMWVARKSNKRKTQPSADKKKAAAPGGIITTSKPFFRRMSLGNIAM
ncbi:hypothetical protein BG011_009107 [Mortierella polycephala]|uniref:Uncharacterized protein n=1 Tax=Mortierella polycephala TaxID=41804 RepID=A0A9P6PNN8_9FUNG|nr:hypothetical protein BG011_009107 [Mortierella polycephala]